MRCLAYDTLVVPENSTSRKFPSFKSWMWWLSCFSRVQNKPGIISWKNANCMTRTQDSLLDRVQLRSFNRRQPTGTGPAFSGQYRVQRHTATSNTCRRRNWSLFWRSRYCKPATTSRAVVLFSRSTLRHLSGPHVLAKKDRLSCLNTWSTVILTSFDVRNSSPKPIWDCASPAQGWLVVGVVSLGCL